MEAHAIVPDNPFAGARAKFEALAGRLHSTETSQMTHSELERLVKTVGREVLRQLMQDHLDLRALGTPTEPVVGEDGRVRPQARMRERGLNTIFGKVDVPREGFSANNTPSLFVLDAELNLPEELYSLGLRRCMVEEVIRGSYEEAIAAVARATGVQIPKRQAEELAKRAALDFEAFYAQRTVPPGAQTEEVLVVTADGKGVVMREQDLRPETRNRRQKRKEKRRKERERGKGFGAKVEDEKKRKKDTKRRAQVAAVYTVARWVRTLEDIVGELRKDRKTERPRPRPEHKRVWANVRAKPHEVLEEAFREAQRRDPEHIKDWVVLVDAEFSQLDTVLEFVGRTNPRARVIVDLLHALSYVWAASKALCGNDHEAAEEEVTRRLAMLLEGKATQVAAGMRRSATRQGLSRKARKPVEKAASYLQKHAEFMRYDEYIAAGLPIATGVIEGACKHLIKDRMEITGARWGLDGAEAVLKLRALHLSGDLDEYWTFHEEQEYRRNHASRYADQAPPKLHNPAFRPKTGEKPRLRLVT